MNTYQSIESTKRDLYRQGYRWYATLATESGYYRASDGSFVKLDHKTGKIFPNLVVSG